MYDLDYSMYNDHNWNVLNEWSTFLNHDIIYKLLTNKNTQPRDFENFEYCPIDCTLKFI